jgi:hypothetical protein
MKHALYAIQPIAALALASSAALLRGRIGGLAIVLIAALAAAVAACGSREVGPLGPGLGSDSGTSAPFDSSAVIDTPDAAVPFDTGTAFDSGSPSDAGDTLENDGGPVCTGRPEAECAQTPGCMPLYCAGCGGGPFFAACGHPGEHAICPFDCPASCPRDLTEAECTSRSNLCHPVYKDNSALCDCAGVDCCIDYDHCSNGAKAMCTPAEGPPCNITTCGTGNFVPAFNPAGSLMCEDGCVKRSECG